MHKCGVVCILHVFGCEPWSSAIAVTKEGRRSPYGLHRFDIYPPVSFTMDCNDLGPLTNLVVP